MINDLDAKPTLDLSSIVPDESTEIEEDDAAWEAKYWKGPLLLMHGMLGNADSWINKS